MPKTARPLAQRMYWRMALLADQWADARRYRRFAMAGETAEGRVRGIHLEAQLTRDYHRVEKGLALPAPRRPFGRDRLARLDTLLARTDNDHGHYVDLARGARDALVSWNAGGDPRDAVAPHLDRERRLDSIDTLFQTRRSVRDFADQEVDEALLLRAAELAGSSPSVCNRSPWRLRYYRGSEAQEVLEYQNGNGGFRSTVPAAALVSVELGWFAGPRERNQAFIEGGIFATSLMLALHGSGLDTCMLNLSQTTEEADRLRRAIGMPASEAPIMMLAIGYGREGHRVARSPRRSMEEIVRHI